jgi:hypothetical protein
MIDSGGSGADGDGHHHTGVLSALGSPSGVSISMDHAHAHAGGVGLPTVSMNTLSSKTVSNGAALDVDVSEHGRPPTVAQE